MSDVAQKGEAGSRCINLCKLWCIQQNIATKKSLPVYVLIQEKTRLQVKGKRGEKSREGQSGKKKISSSVFFLLPRSATTSQELQVKGQVS